MNERSCARCVLDTTDRYIEFDENGVCNYCRDYAYKEKLLVFGKYSTTGAKEIISVIKNEGKNKKYDSMIGISGGLDSSYLLYYAKKLGLIP